jgi:hypothetical protein
VTYNLSMAETAQRKPGLVSRIATALRPKKSNTLTKAPPSGSSGASTLSWKSRDSTLLKKEPRLQTGAIYRPEGDEYRNEQTGEDHTDLIHGLAHRESNDSLDSLPKEYLARDTRPPGEPLIASLPSVLWEQITSYLSACEAANLTFSSKTLLERLGPAPWLALEQPENHEEKIKFLLGMDRFLPDHLLCFFCAAYHLRTRRGNERLKATSIPNQLYVCPNFGKAGMTPPRIRLTRGHALPFTFVQLVLRAKKYSPDYGLPPEVLSKRYKDTESEWQHQTRYYIHKGHLLLRVVSRSFAEPDLPPSGLRHLLYSREDFTPYFSACAHWRDGELMDICKCALGHIPKHRQPITQQLTKGPRIQFDLRNPNPIVTLCSVCRPMRRCPECPTEYLVELKLSEDKNDPLVRFKQSIVVTRWSDLGDGSSPSSPEWAAVSGEQAYDSFARIGRRGVSGIFESQSGVTMPGQRLLSLNPKMEKLGEEGHRWY